MIRADQLVGRLIPAVPVPFDSRGIAVAAQERYAAWMAGQDIGGVAVWAHTGRGLLLDEGQRRQVLPCWRKAIASPRFVIAAAGAPRHLEKPDEVMVAARTMALQACELGADAVLVHPPTAFRSHNDRDALIQDYHAAVAEAGLPLVLFYLYEAAGGISYSEDVLIRLLSRPDVLGIKLATLDSVMTFQDVASLLQSRLPEKVLVTGEDRFLGYSFMAGARAALVGMGAACTALQAKLLRSHVQGQSERFLELSRTVDELGRLTFRAPMEGYIQRMLWCLVHQGVLPREAANDPFGPALDPAEFEVLGALVQRLERELRDEKDAT